MIVRSNVIRGLVAVFAGACLAVGMAAAPANAAPLPAPTDAAPGQAQGTQTSYRDLGKPKANASLAACPTNGQRVKTSSSAGIYLVGPGNYLYWIPDETVYFSLWDSWSGVVTNNSLWDCYQNGYRTLYYGELVKLSSSSAVYIYDYYYAYNSNGLGDRWIPNEATFNHYAFSWSKIKTVSTINQIGVNWT